MVALRSDRFDARRSSGCSGLIHEVERDPAPTGPDGQVPYDLHSTPASPAARCAHGRAKPVLVLEWV